MDNKLDGHKLNITDHSSYIIALQDSFGDFKKHILAERAIVGQKEVQIKNLAGELYK